MPVLLKIARWANVFWLGFLPVVAAAHHSFAAAFDVGVINELEGDVTRVQWRNPHITFTIRTIDAQGRETLYDIETHSLSILRRMDIASDVLAVGDRIKVAGHPARQSINAMFVLNALLPSGQELVFDPRIEPRWGNQTVESSEYWIAPQTETQEGVASIFRVWSTVISDPGSFPLFPEGFVPTFDINSYPLTEAAKIALAAFNPLTDTPTLDCAPKGMPTIMEQPYPMEFVEQGQDILLRLEEYDTVRTIHPDSDGSGAGQAPSLLGYSTGHWEGNTLVVATTQVDWPHFDTVGIPLSEAVELIEWFTPSADGTRLSYRLSVTDPATFTEPVVLEKFWLAVPNISVEPYECTN